MISITYLVATLKNYVLSVRGDVVTTRQIFDSKWAFAERSELSRRPPKKASFLPCKGFRFYPERFNKATALPVDLKKPIGVRRIDSPRKVELRLA